MLEFIVLGQVPGTHIYISFTLALAVFAVASGLLVLNIKSQNTKENHTQKPTRAKKTSV
jgi:hypothetical protein